MTVADRQSGRAAQLRIRPAATRRDRRAHQRAGTVHQAGRPQERGGQGGVEIIYALAPSVWGCGLGTELAAAVVADGFDPLQLGEVFATVAAPNTASPAVLRMFAFAPVRDIQEADGSTTRVLVLKSTVA